MTRKAEIQRRDWNGRYYYPNQPDRVITEVETRDEQVVLHFEDGDRESVSYRQFSYEDLKRVRKPSMCDVENWEVARGSDGDGWRNVETDTNLGILPSEHEEKGAWVLSTDNHGLYWFDDKAAAREAALEWMLENPRPVNL